MLPSKRYEHLNERSGARSETLHQSAYGHSAWVGAVFFSPLLGRCKGSKVPKSMFWILFVSLESLLKYYVLLSELSLSPSDKWPWGAASTPMARLR